MPKHASIVQLEKVLKEIAQGELTGDAARRKYRQALGQVKTWIAGVEKESPARAKEIRDRLVAKTSELSPGLKVVRAMMTQGKAQASTKAKEVKTAAKAQAMKAAPKVQAAVKKAVPKAQAAVKKAVPKAQAAAKKAVKAARAATK